MSKLTITLNNGDVDTVIGEIEVEEGATDIEMDIWKGKLRLTTDYISIPRPKKKVWKWVKEINGHEVITKEHLIMAPENICGWERLDGSEKEVEG